MLTHVSKLLEVLPNNIEREAARDLLTILFPQSRMLDLQRAEQSKIKNVNRKIQNRCCPTEIYPNPTLSIDKYN